MMRNLTLSCLSFLCLTGLALSQNIVGNPTATQTIGQPPNTEFNINRFEAVRYADQFPGAPDMGLQIDNAYADCPNGNPNQNGGLWVSGCRIKIPAGYYVMTTAVHCTTQGKPCLIEGEPGGATTLAYSQSNNTAIVLDWGTSEPSGGGYDTFPAGGVRDLTVVGSGTAGGSTGIWLGPGIGITEAVVSSVSVSEFWVCMQAGYPEPLYPNTWTTPPSSYTGSFAHTVEKSAITGCEYGLLLPIGNENIRLVDSIVARNATGVYVQGAGDLYLMNDSFDDNTTTAIAMQPPSGFHVHGFGNHFENSGGRTSQYVVQSAGHLELWGGVMMDDGHSPGATNTEFVTTSCCEVILDGVAVWSGGPSPHTLNQAVNMTGEGNAALHLNNVSPSTIPQEYNSLYTGGEVWNQGTRSDLSVFNATMSKYNLTVTGNLNVHGTLTKGSGSFKIDHPLDPQNKYLSHSFVESPDMMNIYNGNVVTDRRGLATIHLPGYFEALNKDFRYQLTPVGQLVLATVATEIKNNTFTIKTSKPGVKVSWQVTGVRHDAFADSHRILVEEEKPAQDRGSYLYPDLFVKPAETAVNSALK